MKTYFYSMKKCCGKLVWTLTGLLMACDMNYQFEKYDSRCKIELYSKQAILAQIPSTFSSVFFNYENTYQIATFKTICTHAWAPFVLYINYKQSRYSHRFGNHFLKKLYHSWFIWNYFFSLVRENKIPFIQH